VSGIAFSGVGHAWVAFDHKSVDDECMEIWGVVAIARLASCFVPVYLLCFIVSLFVC
jgi:hypothetical protein